MLAATAAPRSSLEQLWAIGWSGLLALVTFRHWATAFVDNIMKIEPSHQRSATIPTNDFDLRIRLRNFGIYLKIRPGTAEIST